MADNKNWMEEAFGENPGALHRHLGVPEGETIPANKLEKAASGKMGKLVKKEANLAKIGKRFGGKRGGKRKGFGGRGAPNTYGRRGS